MQFFIILSSCENWVTQTSKILLQLDSSHWYEDFEVQYSQDMIKIKEVISNQNFWVLLHVLIPIFYSFYSDTSISSAYMSLHV